MVRQIPFQGQSDFLKYYDDTIEFLKLGECVGAAVIHNGYSARAHVRKACKICGGHVTCLPRTARWKSAVEYDNFQHMVQMKGVVPLTRYSVEDAFFAHVSYTPL